MKIQCSCGAKFSFEVTPEMARAPVRFVCSECGKDSSELVNQLIRQETGAATASSVAVPTPPSPTPPAPPRPAVQARAAAAPAGAGDCLKHPGQTATSECVVCHKPMCPKCMELFGHVCSALCRGKAEAERLEVPVYEGRKTVVEGRQRRRVALVAGLVSAMVMAVLGVWFWYAWFGSQPKVRWSVAFAEAATSGQCRLGPSHQLVVLHGATLARYDLAARQTVWTNRVLDAVQFTPLAELAAQEALAARQKAINEGEHPDDLPKTSAAALASQFESATRASLRLLTRGEAVWVMFPDKLVRYDWASGRAVQELAFSETGGEPSLSGDEFLLLALKASGGALVTHVNVLSGQTSTEEMALAQAAEVAAAADTASTNGAGRRAVASDRGGVPSGGQSESARALAGAQAKARAKIGAMARTPGGASGQQPLDPKALADRAQSLALPDRLALPVVAASAAHQERLFAEMREQASVPATSAAAPTRHLEYSTLIPAGNGFAQWTVKLMERRIVTRQAMKDPPKKSALDAGRVTDTAEVANEIFNEMQRDRGGATVQEDESRYQVTLRRPGAAPWTGELVGAPLVFPLETVDVVTAGKTAVVLDKSGRKRWESKLNYPLSEDFGADPLGQLRPAGAGPCVERGDTLYLFDQGVLAAFDLATGTARWRLPSVGVSGLHFDEGGLVYINTTTANPDTLKYSRQIDITQRSRPAILKVDPKQGKMLWRTEGEGQVVYVAGKFVYTLETFAGDDPDRRGLLQMGSARSPFVRIKRLDPATGRVAWEYYEPWLALDTQFDRNSFQVLFKKELQALGYAAW